MLLEDVHRDGLAISLASAGSGRRRGLQHVAELSSADAERVARPPCERTQYRVSETPRSRASRAEDAHHTVDVAECHGRAVAPAGYDSHASERHFSSAKSAKRREGLSCVGGQHVPKRPGPSRGAAVCLCDPMPRGGVGKGTGESGRPLPGSATQPRASLSGPRWRI